MWKVIMGQVLTGVFTQGRRLIFCEIIYLLQHGFYPLHLHQSLHYKPQLYSNLNAHGDHIKKRPMTAFAIQTFR